MKCPNCGTEVPAHPFCGSCGAALNTGAAPVVLASEPVSVPLTGGQRARLLFDCVPLVAFGVMVLGYFELVRRAIIPPPVPFFYLFIAVVFLFLGYQALQRVRDLVSGSALAQEDILNRSHRSTRGPGGGKAFGQFEQIGRMRIIDKAYFQNQAGQRYRVVYSPASKIVWALESPDTRILS